MAGAPRPLRARFRTIRLHAAPVTRTSARPIREGTGSVHPDQCRCVTIARTSGTPNVSPTPTCTSVVVQAARAAVGRRSRNFRPIQVSGNASHTPATTTARFRAPGSAAPAASEKMKQTSANSASLISVATTCFIGPPPGKLGTARASSQSAEASLHGEHRRC